MMEALLVVSALLFPQDAVGWIEKLRDDDLEARNEAASALIEAGAVREVIPLLQDGDPEVAGRARDILVRIGLPAIPLLEAAGEGLAGGIALGQSRDFLKDSDAYTVEWNKPARWKEGAEVETGRGNGHGGGFEWCRFRGVKEGVEVLKIELKIGYVKWHPDRPRVKVERAVLDRADWVGILRVLGALHSAGIRRVNPQVRFGSSADFWSMIRVQEGETFLMKEEYAGYVGTSGQPAYAKADAAMRFVRSSLNACTFKDHVLTDGERAWASRRFIRDCGDCAGKSSYWWVYERGIILSGVVCDRSVLPTLREIIKGDPEKRPAAYAIHAATKLLGKDVREPSVEEMNVVATRAKLLPLLERAKEFRRPDGSAAESR